MIAIFYYYCCRKYQPNCSVMLNQNSAFQCSLIGQYNFINSLMQMLSPQKQKINPQNAIFKNRNQIRSLTTSQKQLYPNFNIFQLEMSRLYKIPMFAQLSHQIQLFNRQLIDWKKDNHKIKNLVITYHLYENLSSRLKFLCNCSKNQDESLQGTQQIAQWFYREKPRLRCQVKDVKVTMKPSVPDQQETNKMQEMVQYSQLKRQMLPYEMMSRTAHSGLLPPKQQLKQFKRKTFLPFEEQKHKQANMITVKKSNSATLLSKNRLTKFRQSVGTMMTSTTMNDTRSTFKNTVSQFKLTGRDEQKKEDYTPSNRKQENFESAHVIQEEDVNIENIQIDQKMIKEQQEKLDQMQRQKQVGQQALLQQNIQQNLGEEDQPDEDAIYDEEDEPQTKCKIYCRDHDPQQQAIAEQLSKQQNQSTLRRVMKINQDKIRSKFQDLDIKRNMMNWGKIKGKNSTDIARKLEANLHMNKFKQLAHRKHNLITNAEAKQFEANEKKYFNATTGFKGYKQEITSQKKQAKNIVPMIYRSKSSHQASLESQIRKLRIKETMNVYGKYINHIPVQAQETQSPEQKIANNVGYNDSMLEKQTEQTNFRSTSLTSFTSNATKKRGLSTLLRQHNPTSYNELADEQMFKIKKTLSGKMVFTEKAEIYRGLTSIPTQQILPGVGMYTSGRDLLSNPFFPKNIGKKKKKK